MEYATHALSGLGFICAIEFPEHALVRDWIRPDAAVMEFGARFGTTSCEIAKKLEGGDIAKKLEGEIANAVEVAVILGSDPGGWPAARPPFCPFAAPTSLSFPLPLVPYPPPSVFSLPGCGCHLDSHSRTHPLTSLGG